MQGEMLHHLARRGADVVASGYTAATADGEEVAVEVPGHAVVVLGFTGLLFFLFMASIRYTLWGVVANLAMIEQPQNTYLVREEKVSAKSADPNAEDTIDSEVILIKNKPITSSIRATMKHLTSRAGRLSRWRGLPVFAVYMFAHSLINNWISGFFFNGINNGFFSVSFHPERGVLQEVMWPKLISSTVATALLARLEMTWCHVVISEPSTKSWWARVPERKTWKNVVLPAVVADLATRLSLVLPGLCFMLLAGADAGNKAIVTSQLLTCLGVFLVTFIGIAIPATVTLARVQASMLPEEHGTMVPFDRTFGGRVVPRPLGGSGAISFKDAWTTFDYASRLRIVKLCVKFFSIDVALHVFFAIVLVVEAVAMIGPEQIHRHAMQAKELMN